MDKYFSKVTIGNLSTTDMGKTWNVEVTYTLMDKDVPTNKVVNFPVDVSQPLGENGVLSMYKRVFEKIAKDENVDVSAVK